MDAANLDLKAFTDRFYYTLCGGHLEPVLETILYLRRETDVWFELTYLLIPGENDSEREIEEMTQWVAEELGPDVPFHRLPPGMEVDGQATHPYRDLDPLARHRAQERAPSCLYGQRARPMGLEHLLPRLW